MANDATNASERIDERIKELGDWRGETLSRVRAKATNPGTPVWSHNGDVCTGESYKSVVKLTFLKGASLNDPSGLFNSSLDGMVRRAIDIKENEKINEGALKKLIGEAVALNVKGK
jgi:hypothetical protein